MLNSHACPGWQNGRTAWRKNNDGLAEQSSVGQSPSPPSSAPPILQGLRGRQPFLVPRYGFLIAWKTPWASGNTQVELA